MTYATEHIARTLRRAREARGLSQRALGARTGIPQSHISKIEKGAVDLRVSSLVELARVLDLELELVVRKALPAVHAIVGRGGESTPAAAGSGRRALKELERIQDLAARAARARPTAIGLARIQQQVRELRHFPIAEDRLNILRNAAAAVEAYHENTASLEALQDALAQLRDLRNALVHALPTSSDDAEMVRSAYSLEDDDHG
ncbi:MAG: helix-turn-helix transcriptional regulator [Alphaproteobacteria bacterium]|nr:helix-turn-helix transcriptional regulator [Alphaproteobacteria bacterium]MYE01001.1 helix-turn-helix transcriptional regulator [Alphaproteobacteria bacterium]